MGGEGMLYNVGRMLHAADLVSSIFDEDKWSISSSPGRKWRRRRRRAVPIFVLG